MASERAHNFQSFGKRQRHLPWRVCKGCGLVTLRNDATRRAMRRSCAKGDKLEAEGKRLAERWGLK